MPLIYPFRAICNECLRKRKKCEPLLCCESCVHDPPGSCIWKSFDQPCTACVSSGVECHLTRVCKGCRHSSYFRPCITSDIRQKCIKCSDSNAECTWCLCRSNLHCRRCHDDPTNCDPQIPLRIHKRRREAETVQAILSLSSSSVAVSSSSVTLKQCLSNFQGVLQNMQQCVVVLDKELSLNN